MDDLEVILGKIKKEYKAGNGGGVVVNPPIKEGGGWVVWIQLPDSRGMKLIGLVEEGDAEIVEHFWCV